MFPGQVKERPTRGGENGLERRSGRGNHGAKRDALGNVRPAREFGENRREALLRVGGEGRGHGGLPEHTAITQHASVGARVADIKAEDVHRN
jgi:hypothetical protein